MKIQNGLPQNEETPISEQEAIRLSASNFLCARLHGLNSSLAELHEVVRASMSGEEDSTLLRTQVRRLVLRVRQLIWPEFVPFHLKLLRSIDLQIRAVDALASAVDLQSCRQQRRLNEITHTFEHAARMRLRRIEDMERELFLLCGRSAPMERTAETIEDLSVRQRDSEHQIVTEGEKRSRLQRELDRGRFLKFVWRLLWHRRDGLDLPGGSAQAVEGVGEGGVSGEGLAVFLDGLFVAAFGYVVEGGVVMGLGLGAGRGRSFISHPKKILNYRGHREWRWPSTPLGWTGKNARPHTNSLPR